MTEDQHKHFLRRAIQIAQTGMEKNEGGPFGAVIVQNGVIIAEGNNHVSSCNDPTAHAEIVAIRRACEKLNTFHLENSILYSSCEPCPMCFGAIYWSKIQSVYFASDRDDAATAGFDDQFIYEELSKAMLNRKIDFSQIIQPEGQALFKKWEDKSDKILY